MAGQGPIPGATPGMGEHTRATRPEVASRPTKFHETRALNRSLGAGDLNLPSSGHEGAATLAQLVEVGRQGSSTSCTLSGATIHRVRRQRGP